MSKTVLLTGGSGSIGVHFIAHFLENTDWNIVNIASFRHRGDFDRLTEIAKDHEDFKDRVTHFHHDLFAPFTDREVEKLGQIDYILNLASLSDVQASIDNPTPFVRNNIESMLTMLDLSCKLKPSVFLQFSTDETMGPARVDQAHKEWETVLPSNPYAASKASQEALAISWWRSFDLPLIITNTQNNFGEMQQPSKYPVIVQKALQNNETLNIHNTNGGQIGTRYYIHSRDSADAVLFLLNNTKPYMHKPGEVDRPDRYNIVGGKQVDNLELAQIIARMMGKKLKYNLVNFHSTNPGHDLHYGIDGTKIESLGWKAPLGFEKGLRRTIEWQEKHKEWICK